MLSSFKSLFLFLSIFFLLTIAFTTKASADCTTEGCEPGYECKNTVEVYNAQPGHIQIPTSLGVAGINIPLPWQSFLPYFCTPEKDKPAPCRDDNDCGVYVCDKGFCNSKKVRPALKSSLPDRLCSNNVCQTAVGPIPTEPPLFIAKLFSILLSLSGGIALLLIIYSGYRIMSSQGNPEKLQGAKETLTSAIVGLLFIIFSLVILQFIGVEILNVPGFINP